MSQLEKKDVLVISRRTPNNTDRNIGLQTVTERRLVLQQEVYIPAAMFKGHNKAPSSSNPHDYIYIHIYMYTNC